MYTAPCSDHLLLTLNLPFKVILSLISQKGILREVKCIGGIHVSTASIDLFLNNSQQMEP